ncbi:MAG: ATP-binding protein [Shinella sp.]|nr:ATP-binding protein [Shinella sp.]
MGDTIRLKTNQQRLIANLRHAFNPSSMLGELLQNARRAKASHIRVTAGDTSITVEDDGIGIADLQSLIFIAASGWDPELQARENAFGMGVLSTLYFSERLLVHSGDRSFGASTAQIIAGEPIHVYEAPVRVGTGIRLEGVKSPTEGLVLSDWVGQQLRRLATAFPVRISFNGSELPRPLADPALPWRDTPVGKILIDLDAQRFQWRAFLQGLPIGKDMRTSEHHVVLLHDDMIARLPDRQYLLNEREDNQRIQDAVSTAFRQALIEKKGAMAPEEFIDAYGSTCLSSSNGDLLNDIPFAQCSWFRNWRDVPPGHGNEWEGRFQGGVVAAETLTETGVWLVDMDDDEEKTVEVYLCARNGFLLEEQGLHSGHWLNRISRVVAPEQVIVRHGAILHREEDAALVEMTDLVLTDSIHLSLADDPAEYPVSSVRKDGVVHLTADASNVTRLISDYVFDNRYDERARDEDRETIATFIAIGLSKEPARAVEALLPEHLRYMPQPKLANVTVRLVFDGEGKLKNVIS